MGRLKAAFPDMPSHLMQSGASASRPPQSPTRPLEECATSLAWQTFKRAHKGTVVKSIWEHQDGRKTFICNWDPTFQEEELSNRIYACEHTWLIINSFHLLLLKKYCKVWQGVGRGC